MVHLFYSYFIKLNSDEFFPNLNQILYLKEIKFVLIPEPLFLISSVLMLLLVEMKLKKPKTKIRQYYTFLFFS